METTLIIGTSKGAAILRSAGNRAEWHFDGLELQGWKVTAATRDAAGRYYLGVSQDIYGTAIVVSDDLKEWRQIEQSLSYAPGTPGNELHNRIAGAEVPVGDYDTSQRHVDQIWKLHAVRDEIYAGVSEAGIFRSTDRGETWKPLAGLNDHPSRDSWEPGAGGLCAHTFLADEENPARFWVGISSSGVFRTDDGGKTWVPKNDGVDLSSGICVHSLAHDPNEADVIYRQDHRGVYITRDGGDTWLIAEDGLPVCKLSDDHECSFGFASAFDIASGTAFVVPLNGDGFRFPRDGELAVYSSANGGKSWSRQRTGLPDNMYDSILRGAMAVDQQSPGGVYFGTSSGSVFASNDLGDSWQEVASNLPARPHRGGLFRVRNAPEVTIVLPRVLAQLTGGKRRFQACGLTLREALLDLGTTRPGLMVHFFDDAGRVRKYIICIHGSDYVRAPALGEHGVNDGDVVQIINALAGG